MRMPWGRGMSAAELAVAVAEPAARAGRRFGQRAFLKALAAAIGAGSAVLAAARMDPVEAAYFVEGGGDRVDTNLTVQGNLVVTAPNKVGIGTATPAGTLDVAGDIRINGTQVIGTDGVIKQSYYAQ